MFNVEDKSMTDGDVFHHLAMTWQKLLGSPILYFLLGLPPLVLQHVYSLLHIRLFVMVYIWPSGAFHQR